jgi:hypothetical protein
MVQIARNGDQSACSFLDVPRLSAFNWLWQTAAQVAPLKLRAVRPSVTVSIDLSSHLLVQLYTRGCVIIPELHDSNGPRQGHFFCIDFSMEECARSSCGRVLCLDNRTHDAQRLADISDAQKILLFLIEFCLQAAQQIRCIFCWRCRGLFLRRRCRGFWCWHRY